MCIRDRPNRLRKAAAPDALGGARVARAGPGAGGATTLVATQTAVRLAELPLWAVRLLGLPPRPWAR
eukprot:8430960-Alexandrium_andersonii.AAC.1